MDMSSGNIMIIDENDSSVREHILSKIIAAALLEQVILHTKNRKKDNEVKKA